MTEKPNPDCGQWPAGKIPQGPHCSVLKQAYVSGSQLLQPTFAQLSPVPPVLNPWGQRPGPLAAMGRIRDEGGNVTSHKKAKGWLVFIKDNNDCPLLPATLLQAIVI